MRSKIESSITVSCGTIVEFFVKNDLFRIVKYIWTAMHTKIE